MTMIPGENKRKIAVIFPGVGYTKDRPLLYYAGRLAAVRGYELKHISFSGLKWSKEQLKDTAFLRQMLERCLGMTEEALEESGDLSGDDVVFISKSIGTVVAAAYARKRSLNVKQIMFSPLEFIGDFVIEGQGILFCGDDDPFAAYEAVEQVASDRQLEIHRISGGNHSLETGDVITDIDNLKVMMERVADEL